MQPNGPTYALQSSGGIAFLALCSLALVFMIVFLVAIVKDGKANRGRVRLRLLRNSIGVQPAEWPEEPAEEESIPGTKVVFRDSSFKKEVRAKGALIDISRNGRLKPSVYKVRRSSFS